MTGVQTCALPIWRLNDHIDGDDGRRHDGRHHGGQNREQHNEAGAHEAADLLADIRQPIVAILAAPAHKYGEHVRNKIVFVLKHDLDRHLGWMHRGDTPHADDIFDMRVSSY